ncbi:MAG: ribbon-helix-helix domain-containing protein [Hyphomicrobiaceae bacterium]
MNKSKGDTGSIIGLLDEYDAERGDLIKPAPLKYKIPPSREGKRAVTFYVEPHEYEALRQVSHEARISQTKLLRKALGVVLRTYGRDDV